ncbi:hypothetical protein CRYUN_Cryun14cG0046400 [Craigia yunnanensis]
MNHLSGSLNESLLFRDGSVPNSVSSRSFGIEMHFFPRMESAPVLELVEPTFIMVPDPGHMAFSWFKLYASAVDGRHSYIFRQQEKHIDWMRIEVFSFDSEVAFLSERLNAPVKIPKQEIIDDMLQSSGTWLLRKVKTGI